VIWTQWRGIDLILFGMPYSPASRLVDCYDATALGYEVRKKADGFFAPFSDIFAVQTVEVGHRMCFNDKTGLTRGTS
jgi:hypothetical protein